MKTPFTLSLAVICVTALLTIPPAPRLLAQDAKGGGTTTAEDAAISAAEAAANAALEADMDASQAERDAEMRGNRPVDVDRAKVLRKRADEAVAAFLAALAKAEEAFAKVPSADPLYFNDLDQRMEWLRRLKDALTTPPPAETGGGDVKQQSLASGGVFGDFNNDGTADLVGKVESITGTGETIGHIADIILKNSTDEKVTLTIPPTVLSAVGGGYQPYIVPKATQVTIAPNSTKLVPIDGVCIDGRKPPVGKGVSGALVLLNPSAPNFPKPYRAQLAAGQSVIAATSALQTSGRITTPFSGNPEKERETIIQQTIWIYSAGLNGRPYTKEEFANKLYAQGGFQPPNDLTIAKTGGSLRYHASGAVVTPDPVIASQNKTTSQPATGTPAGTPSAITNAPAVGSPTTTGQSVPVQFAVTTPPGRKPGATTPTLPSGAVITPDPKTLKKPTEAQKEKLDAGVDQFWDTFQLTGKEAKIL